MLVQPAAITAPGPPRNAALKAGNGTLTVTWIAPLSTGGSVITLYKATADPGGEFCTTTTLTCTITSLSPDTAYRVSVRATNRVGTGGSSNVAGPLAPVTIPSIPTLVAATAGDGFADITWTAPASTGGSAIDSYTVTSTPGGLRCTTAGETLCRIEGLTNGTAYSFTVVAHNKVGDSARSVASSSVTPVGKPLRPSPPSAKPLDRGLTASWTAPANGGSPILSYTVTAQPGGASCSTSGLTCTINGLENGTPYRLSVVATNTLGDSPASEQSAVFSPFTKPGQITNPTAEPRPSAALVSWEAPANNGSPITKYTVTSSPSSKTCIATTLTSCIVPGLSNGKSYTFTVKATNAAGESVASQATNAVTPQLSPGAPGTPTAVPGNHTAVVTWTPPRGIRGAAAITGYRVTSYPDGLTCETKGPLTCQVEGLTNGRTYAFRIQALSAVGPGPASYASPPATPCTVPDAPQSVAATPGRKRATVTWEPPTDNGGSPVTAYTVTAEPGKITRSVRSTSAVITGLEVGQSYTFVVSASNAVGSGSDSEPTAPVEIAAVEDPPFGTGFWLGVDEPNATDAGADQTAWAGVIAKANPRVFREQFIWYRIAPTKPADPTNPADPAYIWTKMDSFARLSHAVGAEALVNFYGAPDWAEGAGRLSTAAKGSWKPDPDALHDFGVAMATRYSGNFADPLHSGSKLPRIRMFEAWNEPNYKYFLQPQYETVRKKQTLTLPDRYRALLNAFYDGVKSVQPDSIVMTSGLGPYGRSSSGVEIQPQAFAKGLLCVTGTPQLLKDVACPVKAKFDALAIHPYTLQGKPTDSAIDGNGGGLGNTPDFRRELDAAVRYDNVEPAGSKRLIATEFVWLTNPPGRGTLNGPKLGISPALAGQYTSETIYRLYKWGVNGAVWYGLRDRVNFWPGGLFFAGDTVAASTAKPGLSAFVTPLFVSFSATGARYWSMSHCLGPNATVMFQGKVGNTWKTQIGVTPSEDGVAQDSAARPTGITQFRAIASDATGCSTSSVEMTAGTG